jgi:co-chaperonin GroES (HSP10)
VSDKYEQTMEEAFPEIDAGIKPYGSRVLVQIRCSKPKSKAGIILVKDSMDTEKDNEQVAKVIALGPLCFKNKTTLEPWPEGEWFKPGEFVRVPKYGGDRWNVYRGKDEQPVLFAVFDELNFIGKITVDPRDVVTYL